MTVAVASGMDGKSFLADLEPTGNHKRTATIHARQTLGRKIEDKRKQHRFPVNSIPSVLDTLFYVKILFMKLVGVGFI